MIAKVAGRRAFPSMEVFEAVACALPSPTLYAFAMVGLYSGLRLHEIAALEGRDVEPLDDGAALLHVRKGKGGYEGWSLLYPAGFEPLRDALPWRPRGPLLLNSRRNAWDRKAISKAWGKARDTVPELGGLSFHKTRHRHLSWLLDQGASELAVAMHARHIDKDGHANVGLVRKVYGRPSVDASMGRLRRLSGLQPATPEQMVEALRQAGRALAS